MQVKPKPAASAYATANRLAARASRRAYFAAMLAALATLAAAIAFGLVVTGNAPLRPAAPLAALNVLLAGGAGLAAMLLHSRAWHWRTTARAMATRHAPRHPMRR